MTLYSRHQSCCSYITLQLISNVNYYIISKPTITCACMAACIIRLLYFTALHLCRIAGLSYPWAKCLSVGLSVSPSVCLSVCLSNAWIV